MLGFLACNVVALWHAHQQPLRGTSWLILANLSAMPIGDKHLTAWWEQGQFRLYVVQVDAWTGYERWFTIERWRDLMSYDTQAERDGRVHAEYASRGLSTWQRPRSRNNRWSNNQEAANNIKMNTNINWIIGLIKQKAILYGPKFLFQRLATSTSWLLCRFLGAAKVVCAGRTMCSLQMHKKRIEQVDTFSPKCTLARHCLDFGQLEKLWPENTMQTVCHA